MGRNRSKVAPISDHHTTSNCDQPIGAPGKKSTKMGRNRSKVAPISDHHTASNCDQPIGAIDSDEENTFPNEGDEDLEEELYLVRLLSRKAMHLPHGSWCQDWINFMKNNHPVFGICFHHRLHPLKVQHRLYILLASISFGLTATNAVYLYNAFNNDEMSKVLLQISLRDDAALNINNIEALEVTYGVLFLWTVGGAMHAAFDIGMW
eukprot:CAMPEP_0204612750 /NCGR_PEP_ID=MMETSP0717-20131115/809_1 /ASSEMBLY_ACC=CAM_ASM_000666 /TAXON_ID=230516 /ORGANISM="Chaetoceros curvisetus" /LENGTH=206 /DNA_ID=CAMNT_0051624953 /DNA_START=12 /DNA_END=629 /DNA_ORIENTATION=+